MASGANTNRPELRRLLDQLGVGDVLMVTRLDRLAQFTLNIEGLPLLGARITARDAGTKCSNPTSSRKESVSGPET